MVIDAEGEEFLPESFAATPEESCHAFHRIEWDDVTQRQLDVMRGRFHVRHVRLHVLEPFEWRKDRP